jgi:predicted ABC-type ATPase
VPVLTVVAGANGAGKTTSARVGERLIGSSPITPDDLPGSAMRAGRAAKRAIDEALRERRSFALETTLAGGFALRVMRRAKNLAYEIEFIYIGTSSADINVQRVAARVARGGHPVAEADIRRRYRRSLENLPAALALADRSVLYDNSGSLPMVITAIDGFSRKEFSPFPAWALHVVRCPDAVGVGVAL